MSFREGTVANAVEFYLRNISYGTPRIIADDLKLNYNSVRSALQSLYRAGIVERPDRGIYVIIDQFFRHYLSALAYCGGKKVQYYALTFDEDNSSMESELLNAIINETIDSCGNHEDTGYEISETTEGKNDENTYPQIEVGRL